MIYLKVTDEGSMVRYQAIRSGAKGRTYPGIDALFPKKAQLAEREIDVVAFMDVEKTSAGGTYTDDRD